MSKRVDYFVKGELSPLGDDSYIPVLRSRHIPSALSAIEGRKGRSFWASDVDFARGVNELTLLQIGLLMDAKEELIVEIRAARGPVPPATAYDLATYPVGSFPGYTLGTIDQALRADGATVAQWAATSAARLEAIRLLLETQATNDGDMLETLIQIAGFLAV